MSIVYIGDCSFTEVADRQYEIDPWNMDTVTINVEGRVDQLPLYLSTLLRRRDVQLAGLPGLYMISYAVTAGRTMARAQVRFTGIYTNDIPDPVLSAGYRTQTVTLSNLQAESIQATFEYISPYTRIMYAVKDKPLVQKYRGAVAFSADALQVVSRTGAAGNLKIFGGRYLNTQAKRDLSLPLTGAADSYNAVAESVTNQFDVEHVGQWYRVTENNEIRLQPLDLWNAGFSAQL